MYGLYELQKWKTRKFTMVIAWTKQAGAKGDFRHESQMGHAIEPPMTVVCVHWHRMRKKKDVVYGLLFFLQDLADLRFTNPIRNPCSNSSLLMWLLVVSNWRSIKVFCKAKSKSRNHLQIFSRRNKKLEYTATNRFNTHAYVYIWIFHFYLCERMACIRSKSRNSAHLPWS